jgi:hypothetical protein|tara:strand:+ start:137 stop:475 length:339 start_codon:yes stop_codon:yes gene_type:complete
MHVKYTKKMEDMILSRYRSSKTVQIETAKELLVDFKSMFSTEALKNMTALRIRSKFQTMQKLRRDKQSNPGSFITKTPVPIIPFKDSLIGLMRQSDNMTITVKGTEITVVFK